MSFSVWLFAWLLTTKSSQTSWKQQQEKGKINGVFQSRWLPNNVGLGLALALSEKQRSCFWETKKLEYQTRGCKYQRRNCRDKTRLPSAYVSPKAYFLHIMCWNVNCSFSSYSSSCRLKLHIFYLLHKEKSLQSIVYIVN